MESIFPITNKRISIDTESTVSIEIESTFPQLETTDGENRTENNYDCHNFQQVFTEVPVNIKHVFPGVPKISNTFSRE